MAYNSPFYGRAFCQIKPNLRTILNNSGTWNNATAQAIRIMQGSLQMAPTEPLTKAQWIHGTRSQLQAIKGRKGGTVSMDIPVVPSGTPGTAPDMDPILQAIFGGAPTIVAGTSVTYNIFDQTNILLDLFEFAHNTPTTGNRYALGFIPQRISVTFNGNILECKISGLSVTVVQNEEFTYVDAIAKGGLSAFPLEPTSFSLTGAIIPGFGGSLTLDGQTITDLCDMFDVEFDTGYNFKGDFVDDAYPAMVTRGLRVARVNVRMVNTDSSAIADLKQKGRTGAPITGSFLLGSTPGYQVGVGFGGLQVLPSTLADQNEYVTCSFGQSEASVTPGLANEFNMSFS